MTNDLKWLQLIVITDITAKYLFVQNMQNITIIMYIYHALINALSAHIIHINLNMIFYTHVEHSPTKTIYVKYYKKQTNKNTLQTHTRTHTYTD